MLVSCEEGEEVLLSDLGFDDWKNLARLSDKYDSLMARIRVKSHIWSVQLRKYRGSDTDRFLISVAQGMHCEEYSTRERFLPRYRFGRYGTYPAHLRSSDR